MSQNRNQPTSTGEVQVDELTMDNTEDQDELNRRLRKPGESDPGASPENGQTTPSEPNGTEPGRANG
jgi:hypothetical protein